MATTEQNVTISIKVKLYPDQKTIEEFKKLTTAYSEAATWLSDLMFNDFSSPEMITDRKTLHDKYYYDIRQKKNMKSQLAESLIKSVSAKYKAIGTTFKKQYYTYTDADGNTAKYKKDLNWLQHPVVYKRPQADLVRGRDWSFVNDDNGGLLLSIATLTGRTKDRLKKEFPKTYAYLDSYREELAKRDMDKNTDWFLFGRSQGIRNSGLKKIVFKHIIDKNNPKIEPFILDDDVVVYSGRYITAETEEDLLKAYGIFKTEEFAKYCSLVGKNKSGGYVEVSTKAVKQFGIQEK